MLYYIDKKYNFVEFFNTENGTLVRSNIIKNGIETNLEPHMRSFPELIDIGIMGTCHAGQTGVCKNAGVDCYQNAPNNCKANMSLGKYKSLLCQCESKTFQVALGGAGDPNKHENFEEILKATRECNIVPNLTTSGYDLTDYEIKLMKDYCGAVAISFYSKLAKSSRETNHSTITAIERLVSAGCVTNIHYVLSNKSIDEAIYRLENNLFPKEINAIIFLLYKPVGLASKENMLTAKDERYIKFLKLATNVNNGYKIGFDSCQTPAILNFCNSVARESLEFCEASRFSMYIDCDMKAYPCSFGHNNQKYSVDLNNHSIDEAWNSEFFNLFREKQKLQCNDCKEDGCRNCALDLGVAVCGKL